MAEEKGKYGEFEEVKEGEEGKGEEIVDESGGRVRLPRKGEFIGVVVQRFGGARMEVLSNDGKRRNCRVPGRYKRALWLRPKDIVIIVPWEADDAKGDIIFKYSLSAISQLRKRGLLTGLEAGF